MKKFYEAPVTEIEELKYEGMLCESIDTTVNDDWSDDVTVPGHGGR